MDLSASLNNITKVKLFADDLKIYITIVDDTDVQRLQLALDALVQWSDTCNCQFLLTNVAC